MRKKLFNIVIGIIALLLIALIIILIVSHPKKKSTKVNFPELALSEFTYNGSEQKIELKDKADLNTAYTISG